MLSVSVYTHFSTCSTVLVKSVDHIHAFFIHSRAELPWVPDAPAIYHRVQGIAGHGSGNKAHTGLIYGQVPVPLGLSKIYLFGDK